MRDIVVVTRIDAKPREAEGLDILLLSTEMEKDTFQNQKFKTYHGLENLKKDFEGRRIMKKASAIFDQMNSQSGRLINKVKAVGINPPRETQEIEGIEGSQNLTAAENLILSLEELRKKDDDWYILVTDLDDDESVKALATWAETTEPNEAKLGSGIEDHRKIYFGQTNNKEIGITNARAVICYTDDLEECAEAAYLGCVGPFYPESVTWKFKKPDGVKLSDLTEADKNALEEANINFLSEEYKYQYMKNGTCANGEFIDVQMGADYITKLIRDGLYQVLLNNPKIPYSDEGFTLAAAPVFSALDKAATLGIVAKSPKSRRGNYEVTIPRFTDATDDQIRSRQMPPIYWQAQLDGAVHSAKVDGTLKVILSTEGGE